MSLFRPGFWVAQQADGMRFWRRALEDFPDFAPVDGTWVRYLVTMQTGLGALPKEWSLSRRRALIARACRRTGMSALMSRLGHLANPRGAIRVVNYHQTLPGNAETLERHLQWYERHFCPAGPGDLRDVMQGRTWTRLRPGIVLTFDDGLRSNFEVAAPLLERYGMRGWFFVTTGLTDCPDVQQRQHAAQHRLLGAILEQPSETGRIAMSWDELRQLRARGHQVGSHTHSHARLGEDVDPGTVRSEVFDSKARLESMLAAPVSSFCWVGGELGSYSRHAADCIREAGYEFAFQTTCALTTARTNPHQIPRTNVEDRWPVEMAAFQTSGLLDLAYLRKRRSVQARTRPFSDARTAACTPRA